jgi:hypothetical protein
MALITKASLRRGGFTKAASILESQAKSLSLAKSFDVFLSHSYADAKDTQALNADDLLALKEKLEKEHQLSVYVDWIVDKSLDRSKVDAQTAARLRARMDHCRCLLYATSEQAENSKWMPWELGYFDGKKGRVAILPIVDKQLSTYKGQEYLGLYPYVDEVTAKGSTKMSLWVNESSTKYIALSAWLEGQNPTDRSAG